MAWALAASLNVYDSDQPQRMLDQLITQLNGILPEDRLYMPFTSSGGPGTETNKRAERAREACGHLLLHDKRLDWSKLTDQRTIDCLTGIVRQ
jgi:hypothetical protein